MAKPKESGKGDLFGLDAVPYRPRRTGVRVEADVSAWAVLTFVAMAFVALWFCL